MEYYENSLQYLLAELERIDRLIQIQVWRARQIATTDPEFQGLYLSEAEVDILLAQPIGMPPWATVPLPNSFPEVQATLEAIAETIHQRKAESLRAGIPLRLDDLRQNFQLLPLDVDILLVCLAPELDSRYERLYAYLQNDVTRKRPQVELVLNLLSSSLSDKLSARQRFSSMAPLFKYGLLSVVEEPAQSRSPFLNQVISLDRRIVNYLLEVDEPDSRLALYLSDRKPEAKLADLLLPSQLHQDFERWGQQSGAMLQKLVFYFQGAYGVGKQTAAEALSQAWGLGLLKVNGTQLLEAEDLGFSTALNLVLREARLQQAAVYWQGFDALLDESKQTWRSALLRQLADLPLPVFLAGNTTWEPASDLHDCWFLRVEFPPPTAGERSQLWQRFLPSHPLIQNPTELQALAGKFRFSGGQIQDAVSTAHNLARWQDPTNGQISSDDLYAACRLQSNQKLSTLAQKINPHYGWDDIVLPGDRLQQLQEICHHLKYRVRVYGEWGFDRKLALGKGLNALFAGPSGTGKTMAADVLAGALGLDLYKIDLSTVVSKYIGETEKNLARIFTEAETSNAILFFDEADALFGKRSEVRDAHDRYANIEISYLLQRMEEFEGVAILASNLRKNMDEAFVRRMHFIVDFPFPDESHRLRIWQKIWPDAVLARSDLDLEFMAHRFELAGGHIRNIALAAAFLAAGDGGVVTNTHLIRALQREYQKMGKVLMDGELGAYARLG